MPSRQPTWRAYWLGASWLLIALLGREATDHNDYVDQQPADQSDSRILVIGDSVMWWGLKEQSSVSDGMSEVLGEPVINLAVPGARISADDPALVAQGFDISAQYQSKAWDWVVVEGGANDLADECRCNACEDVLEELVTEDGASGEIPDLVQKARSDGAQVVVLGYYAPPRAGGDFTACADELSELSSRIETLADKIRGVTYPTCRWSKSSIPQTSRPTTLTGCILPPRAHAPLDGLLLR